MRPLVPKKPAGSLSLNFVLFFYFFKKKLYMLMGRVCEETGRKFEFKLRAIFYLFIYGRASEVHACRPARLRLYVIVAEVGRVLDE